MDYEAEAVADAAIAACTHVAGGGEACRACIVDAVLDKLHEDAMNRSIYELGGGV